MKDFQLQAEWHFFTTSPGKNACDGIGGTIKRLAARSSLQRTISEQILTPKQLFEYAKKEIHAITTFFIDTQSVNRSVLDFHRKNHEFIPIEGNVLMNRISGAHSVKPLIKSKANLLSIENILPGTYYACLYDKDWYIGVQTLFLSNIQMLM